MVCEHYCETAADASKASNENVSCVLAQHQRMRVAWNDRHKVVRMHLKNTFAGVLALLHQAKDSLNLRIFIDRCWIDKAHSAGSYHFKAFVQHASKHFRLVSRHVLDGSQCLKIIHVSFGAAYLKIDTCKCNITQERHHLQPTVRQDIFLPNFNEPSKWCNALPGLSQSLTGQRVEHNVNTLARSGSYDGLCKG